MKKIYLNWKLRYETEKEYGEYFDATVPGNAQHDYASHYNLPDYKWSDNYKKYKFLEDYAWRYKAKLPKVAGDFVCVGIDYDYVIFIDGKEVYRYEGMFKDVRIPIKSTDLEIEIFIKPIPKRKGADEGRHEADNVCKPPVAYGWDWHPRLIPSGIWQEAFVETERRITEFFVTYRLSDDFKTAFVKVRACESGGESVAFTLSDMQGNVIFSDKTDSNGNLSFTVENPNLWWCNEQGEQYLYTAVAQISGDVKTKKIGFRRTRLIPREKNWDIDNFPFTQAVPPITLELNGKTVFCKGSNFVNPEIFTGLMNEETYRPLIQLAKENHFNMFRCWGGAPVNKESFFDLCDEMGIMVWQEFPLACNCYKDDEHYLEVLNSESKAIINRVKQHACLVLWCGGNELYTGGSSMTEQFKALRLLNSNCFTLDCDTPFINTSPILGMRHGHYVFRYPGGEECLHGFQRVKATAYTEFGSPAASDFEYLKTFIPKEDLVIPTNQDSWIAHHGLRAWEKASWLHQDIVEYYFGTCTDLNDLIIKGQIIQEAGYKGMFEEARRQKPYCNMVLNWCYNEPWPTAANNSLVNYPARAKGVLKSVGVSLRNKLLSARVEKFTWHEGEYFKAQIFILNDSIHESIKAGKMKVKVALNGDVIDALTWEYPECAPDTNIEGPTVSVMLPHYKSGIFRLVLEGEDESMNNEYKFLYYNQETIQTLRSKMMEDTVMDFVGIARAEEKGISDIMTINLKK